MKNLIQYSLLTIIVCALISACGEYPCGKASSYIALLSFTPAESDTIIVRRFNKGNNFLNLKDTIIIDKSNTNFQQNGDTILVLGGGFNGNSIITSDYDFEIYLPPLNKTYTISEITEPQQYRKNSTRKDYCINAITSYKLNGQLVNAGNSFTRIYIKK